MIARHISKVKETTDISNARGVSKRVLIGKDEGAPIFYMRHFHIKPYGFSPLHSHPWEHEIYIISGKGTVTVGDEEAELKEGMAIFIPPDTPHQIKAQESDIEFLCCIPAIEET
ncbi:MAG: cupin domain-containing protein [Thermodesulfobacteriota bacterium]|nr:cupin domain-containing protein [Thermodesulfobacteriota bacterium]